MLFRSDKKLKMIDLQLKKSRLDQQAAAQDQLPAHQAVGHVMSRNELLDHLLGKNQKAQNE